MIHLEVNFIEDGEEKVNRNLIPLAFEYISDKNELHVYDNYEQWSSRHWKEPKPHKIYTNVTSVAYWDDTK